MVGRLFVVERRRRMMRSTGQFRRWRTDNLPQSNHMRGGIRGGRQGAQVMLAIVRAGFLTLP